jgi:hypothetical protein
MAALGIFEVIFYEGDGEPDTIYVITAHTHLEAVKMAENDQGHRGNANTVSLIGDSRIRSDQPQIIRGPFREVGYTRGDTWLYDSQRKEWLTHEDYYKPRAQN